MLIKKMCAYGFIILVLLNQINRITNVEPQVKVQSHDSTKN